MTIKELQEELETIEQMIPHWRFLFDRAKTMHSKHSRSLALLELFERQKKIRMSISEMQLRQYEATLSLIQAEIALAQQR